MTNLAPLVLIGARVQDLFLIAACRAEWRQRRSIERCKRGRYKRAEFQRAERTQINRARADGLFVAVDAFALAGGERRTCDTQQRGSNRESVELEHGIPESFGAYAHRSIRARL